MATFLFASIPVPAHTTNPIPFAQRLVERGHTVLWYSGKVFHERLRAVGATPLPYEQAEDFGGLDLADHWPEFANESGVSAITQAFAKVFVGQASARVADLRKIVTDHHVDAMLCDQLMYGVGLVSELEGGLPWATFGDGPLPYFEADTPPFGPGLLPMRGPVGRFRNRLVSFVARNVLFAQAQRVYNRTRSDLGLPVAQRPVLDEAVSPFLHLHGAVPAFDYPRKTLPPHVHWVGALRPDPPADRKPPTWWSEVTRSSRPVILVSQGSIRGDLTELAVPTLRALADREVLVVVTTGQSTPAQMTTAFGGALPANVLCAQFIPYDLILPHTSVFVTNGGYTGVTLALAHGVPLVQAGTTEEKVEIAARIHWTGVGVRLGTTRPEAGAVRDAVDAVLRDPRYREAAARVQAQMAEHNAGREGATLLERLAATRAPVTGTDGADVTN